jgi:hypothetical protein
MSLPINFAPAQLSTLQTTTACLKRKFGTRLRHSNARVSALCAAVPLGLLPPLSRPGYARAGLPLQLAMIASRGLM